MKSLLSVGYRVTRDLETDYAEWVRGYGGGHAQAWLDERLWPRLGHLIEDTIAADRAARDAEAKQPVIGL